MFIGSIFLVFSGIMVVYGGVKQVPYKSMRSMGTLYGTRVLHRRKL